MTMIQIPAPVRARPAVSSGATKAGPVGPGAGVLMTEYLLPTALGTQAQERMAQGMKLGMEVDWVRAAERIIAGKIAGCEWKLDDPDGETIGGLVNGEYKDGEEWKEAKAFNPLALGALKLLTAPQAELPISGPDGVGKRLTRRNLFSITSRHMGLAGNAGWFLDELDPLGCPHAILYIRPDRLTPETTDKGVLTDWTLDKIAGRKGIPLDLEEVRLFQLEEPNRGIFAPGLIESSVAKAVNNGLIDRHYSALLASGGRLSGIMAPKEGRIDDDNTYKQLVNDWRNITEQPEAARRLQIVRAPVDFTPTVMSVGEMQIIDLMYHNRDALLALWGVALSLLGGSTSSGGLNSGDTRKYDEAALWQGAVHDRLVEITETVQSILDLWEEPMGWAPKLTFIEPEFDDELPNYQKLKDSANLAMRNKERRALVGLEPFDDPSLDNAIWMPVTVVSMSMAPDEETGAIPEEPDLNEAAKPKPPPAIPGVPVAPGGVPNPQAVQSGPPASSGPSGSPGIPPGPTGKKAAGVLVHRARDLGAKRLRTNAQRHIEPKLRATVQAALDAQAAEVQRLIEEHWEKIVRMPNDDTIYWHPKAQDARMMKAIQPALVGMAEIVEAHINSALNPDES